MMANAVHNLLGRLRKRRHWMPRQQWDALVAGDGCPMCANVGQQETKYGFLVARLEVSNLSLSKNQYIPGYCVLIYREHAAEIHLLPPEAQAAFLRDLVRAGTAVARVFRPDKMNYQLLGNLVPHLHWHIIPRYWGDPAPGRPIDPGGGYRFLEPNEYRRLIAGLQAVLEVA
jgi:diadenosine tetraphosphate (Ap4A) HIT family hydrolase